MSALRYVKEMRPFHLSPVKAI